MDNKTDKKLTPDEAAQLIATELGYEVDATALKRFINDEKKRKMIESQPIKAKVVRVNRQAKVPDELVSMNSYIKPIIVREIFK